MQRKRFFSKMRTFQITSLGASSFLLFRRWGSPRTGTSGSTTNRTSSTIAGTTASSTGSGGIRVRGRIVRAAMRGRTGNSWIGSRPVIPASAVPEDLVAQVSIFVDIMVFPSLT